MKYECLLIGVCLSVTLGAMESRLGKELSAVDWQKAQDAYPVTSLKKNEIIAVREEDGWWRYARVIAITHTMQQVHITFSQYATEADCCVKISRTARITQ